MPPRHRRITTSPPTTVSSARPARTASPAPRSTAGSNAQATRSASCPGASVPDRCRAPAALRRARGVGAHGRRRTRAAPRDASRRPGRRRRSGARAPRRALARIDRRDRHVAPEHHRGAAPPQRPEGVRARGRARPSGAPPAECRSAGARAASRRRSRAPAARSRSASVHALEVLDPVRQRRPRERSHEVERATHGRIADGVHGDGDPRVRREPHGPRRLVPASVMRHAAIAAALVRLQHPGGAAPEAAVQEHLHAADAEPLGAGAAPDRRAGPARRAR